MKHAAMTAWHWISVAVLVLGSCAIAIWGVSALVRWLI